ncbi:MULTISPECIES: APC family permease [Atopobiaceae]|uniref:Agmatine:putrescine antiporter, APC superfamily n=1 Tax=Parafannyhessea umbonata TaxID=604330 RepID=A0A1H6JS64_9ACTN|nr:MULTISPECIES: APC family permease [Atopobiaceae]SEH65033.1 agmatine:putrescine antiporter, APC superfamily [Parafannyhessea umbonata]SJZ65540.1 agmatine:putrescine antiporter, APC superfamily [Olsenella sp. KH1P3]
MGEKKGLSFLTVISTVICVVFVCEAAAPAAAIGNQQFFWWIFLILTFLIPYGLAVAELGTTYDSEGGIIDWIRDGLGDKWAARASYYYWVNYPFWIASLSTLFPAVINMAFGIEFTTVTGLLVELAFTWIVTFMSFSKVSDSEIILNGGAIIKVIVAVLVGCLGIWFASQNGFANDMSFQTFLPSGDLNALSYISIIIFNFMGFEVICTMTGDMKDPNKDIPKAIILGGVAIAAIYLFAGFGIGAAIPSDQIDPDYGMIVAVQAMVGDSILFKAVCVAFLVTLFANMASWSFGVNSAAAYAAKTGNMPKAFGKMNPKTGMPDQAAIINGVVASLVLCIQLIPIEAISNGIFWMLFGLSVVFLLLTYVPMFPAFMNLRKNDPNRERVYKLPFKGVLLKIAMVVPMVELIAVTITTVVPLSAAEVDGKLPKLIGFIVLLAIGEVVRIVSAKDRDEEYMGLTPELAQKRLAEEAAAE